MDASRLADRWPSLLGIVGFSYLTVALLVAHWSPATAYELSIYAATPAPFWIGVAVALLTSLVVSLWATSGWDRLGGLLLGGLATLAIVSLPIVRGYYFTGIHDSLTHVGWARALIEGEAMPLDLLYPGTHSVGAFVSGFTGYSVWRSLQLVPVIFALVYFVFVPLVVREVAGWTTSTPIGAFAAFLLVPMHLIANTLTVHPSSQTILFAPVVLFLLVRYLRSSNPTDQIGLLTPSGGLLFLVTVASILLHPQQAINLIAFLSAVCIVQFVASRREAILPRSARRPVYSIAGASIFVYLTWVAQFPFVSSTVQRSVVAVTELGDPSTVPGSGMVSRTNSLKAIESSLPIMFSKLFLVSTIFLAIAALVLVAALENRLDVFDDPPESTDLILYLGVGLVAAVPIFGLYFLGDVGVFYFREAGYVMMIATILGAVGIAYAIRGQPTTRYRRSVRVATVGGFAVMLVLSTLVLFNSPYIHLANEQITEARVNGYETTFDTTDDSAWMASIRQSPERYKQALVGMHENGRIDGHLNSSQLHDLRDHRDVPWYLVLSQDTYQREIEAYRGYRYSSSDLRAVQRQDGVSLVLANGDMELYHIEGTT